MERKKTKAVFPAAQELDTVSTPAQELDTVTNTVILMGTIGWVPVSGT